MTASTATAPGKVILFGEHAVVYGQPAIAIPIDQIEARAIIKADILAPEGRILVKAEAIGLEEELSKIAKNDPLAVAINSTLAHFSVEKVPAFQLIIHSSIPLAAGLGSGAAVSVAIIRALSAFLGQSLSDEEVSKLALEAEKIHHGTPSGIDNSVVSYGKAVYFEKGHGMKTFTIQRPFDLVIADTGVASATRGVVEEVRAAWKKDPKAYEGIFKEIGDLCRRAKRALEMGQTEKVGRLMNENQLLLEKMKVSSKELETLIQAAREEGALGAKLSGGGKGGNMIALIQLNEGERIAKSLQSAGAKSTIVTKVQ